MKFYDIVASENSDGMYDEWSEYRNQLTEHIISSVENHIIRKKLKRTSSLRLQNEYSMESHVAENSVKPTLAIWGAGGCNDIDIKHLAKYFKLVLIDRDIETLKKTPQKYEINEDCLLIDLKFWDIEDETYKMFEALLKDSASIGEITGFLDEITLKMPTADYKSLPSFDYSVAIGLVSQLNVRFAALLYMYKSLYSDTDIKMINEYIKSMNKKAVDRFMEAITSMTNEVILLGYELSVFSDAEDLETIVRKMNDNFEIMQSDNTNPLVTSDSRSTIEGNIELESYLLKKSDNNKLSLDDWKAFVWPFSTNKKYILVTSLLNTGK